MEHDSDGADALCPAETVGVADCVGGPSDGVPVGDRVGDEVLLPVACTEPVGVRDTESEAVGPSFEEESESDKEGDRCSESVAVKSAERRLVTLIRKDHVKLRL